MFKGAFKRFTSLFLVTIMVLAMIPAASIPVFAASVTTGVAGLTADSSGSATWTSSNGTITGSVQASSSSGCTGTTYTARNGTLTFTKGSGAAALISFDYSLELNGGSATIDGEEVTKTSFSKKLNAGETVAVVITSNAANSDATTITISHLKLTPEANVDITFKAPENGSYTVDGTAITADTTITKLTTDNFALAVTTAANGYKFFGWKNETSGLYISTDQSVTTSFTEDATVKPEFVSNSVPVFQVDKKLFQDLNEAVEYAESNNIEKIVLVSNGTLPAGNYTIPSGKTLLIPFDANYTVVKQTPTVTYNSYATPTAYKTLTMASGANITVQSGGAISLGSQLSSKGQLGGWNGTPTGPDGRIKMDNGSTITVQNGGNLYCWGYIYGSGSVVAESGSTVYEAFQIKDWRGGTATSNVYSYAFILNQYYIQNIEVPLTLYAGATEKLYSSANASSSAYPMGATFVGSGGMFNMTSGYMVKDYIESTDRLQIDFYGNASITPMTLTGLPIIDDISTDSYILPITNNITVNLHESTEISITQDIKLLPSVEINIDSNATLEIPNGKKVYVYDNDDWGNFTGSARLYVIGYSVANGTTAKRTAAGLTDAKIKVNGTLNVNGSLFTSNGGAAIVSDGGGKVVLAKAAPTASSTIYEMANNSTKTEVAFTAAKLQNGDGTYTETAGSAAGTTYYYCKQCNSEGIWETEHSQTHVHNLTEHPAKAATCTEPGNSAYWSCECGKYFSDANGETEIAENSWIIPATGHEYSVVAWHWNEDYSAASVDLKCNHDASHTATKEAVVSNAQGSGEQTGYTVYTATVEFNNQTFTDVKTKINTYTVTWKNEDGTVLETDANVPYGTTPVYNGTTPTKAGDAQYTYTFSGWTPAIAAVTADVTYTAQFSTTLREYTVTWKNFDDTVLKEEEVPYGTVPEYDGTPVRPGTNKYYYKFTEWQCIAGNIVYGQPITCDVVYQAFYKEYSIYYEWSSDNSEVTARAVYRSEEIIETKATVRTVTTEPTCTTGGQAVYTVTFEGEYFTTQTKTVNLPATGHSYGEPEWTWADDNSSATAKFTCKNDNTHVETVNATITSVTTAATCKTAGKKVYTATVTFEGETYTDTKEETIPATGHDYELTGWTWTGYTAATAKFTCKKDSTHVETVNATITSVTTAATCETAGKTVYTATVEFEGKTYTDTKEETIPATGHDYELTGWTWTGYTAATATFTCKKNSEHVVTVDATITSETTDATCEADGKKVYTATATFEGKTYTDTKEEPIPATGHEWGTPTYTWADDYSTVTATRVCAHDANHVETETVNTTSEITKPATCEAKGETTYTATFTNPAFETQTKTVENVPALGHGWNAPTYEWSTDNSSVTATRVCAHDETHVETETVNTTSAITKPATCEAKGETTYTATFTNPAFATQTKTVENIDALGHTHGEAVRENEVAATCTEAGSYDEVVYCTVCHKELSRTAKTTPALGHDWGEWTVTKEATCTETGEETRTCSRCDETETRPVEALGHNPGEAKKENNVDPTCTEAGGYDMVVRCTRCNEIISSEHTDVPALGHDWSEWTVTTAPTCTESGVETRTCSRCGETETRPVEAIGHNYEEGEWSWSEDLSSATLTLVCKNDPAHTTTVTATVTSSEGTGENIGHTVYTATAEYDGKTYTDEKIIINKYTVTFVNYDDTVLQTSEVEYGKTPVYNGETPYKAPDETNVYVFAGWDPEITTVTENATYTAVFEAKTTVWTGPVWSWTDFVENGFDATAKATATFTSGEMTTAKTVVVTGELVKIDGKDTTYAYRYTATVEFNGQTYTDTYSHEFEAVTLIGQTPTLNGVLSINFRFQAPENAATVKFVYEFNNTEVELRLVKDGPYFITEGGSGRYKIAYTNIQSACITKNVTMKVYDADGNEIPMIRLDKNFFGTEFSYCMADWAKAMLDNPEKPDETKQLAHAILNYGYYASEYFGEKNGNAEKYSFNYEKYGEYLDLSMVENVTVDHENDAVGADEAKAKTSYKGALVVLEGSTSIRLYFDSAKSAPTVKDAAGKAYTVYKNDIGYYVEVSGIGSGNLNRKYTFVITGEDGVDYTVKYSVLSWANAMITRGNGANNEYVKTVNLAKALYQYWAAADAYFAIH